MAYLVVAVMVACGIFVGVLEADMRWDLEMPFGAVVVFGVSLLLWALLAAAVCTMCTYLCGKLKELSAAVGEVDKTEALEQVVAAVDRKFVQVGQLLARFRLDMLTADMDVAMDKVGPNGLDLEGVIATLEAVPADDPKAEVAAGAAETLREAVAALRGAQDLARRYASGETSGT